MSARKDRSASRIAANTRHDRAIQTVCLQIKNPSGPRPVGQHAKALAPPLGPHGGHSRQEGRDDHEAQQKDLASPPCAKFHKRHKHNRHQPHRENRQAEKIACRNSFQIRLPAARRQATGERTASNGMAFSSIIAEGKRQFAERKPRQRPVDGAVSLSQRRASRKSQTATTANTSPCTAKWSRTQWNRQRGRARDSGNQHGEQHVA